MSSRRAVVLAGHLGDQATALAGWQDADPSVRASALSALRRTGVLTDELLAAGMADPAAVVRRRACEEAVALGPTGPRDTRAWLIDRLADGDATVVEAACFALGELGPVPDPHSPTGVTDLGQSAAPGGGAGVAPLGRVAADHDDPLCREAAVAALGAIGDPLGLPFILAATGDKPAVRRRAVLALAPFEGPEIDEALARALEDRDWQVRQAAEDMTAT